MHRLNPSRLFVVVTMLVGVASAPAGAQVAPDRARSINHSSRSDTVDLLGLEQAFRNVARNVSPSVVAITASADAPPAGVGLRSHELTASGVERFVNGRPRVVGTGFAIDDEGYILTNEHVIAGARQIYATTDDGRIYPAIVVGSDPRSDLAVLKIPGRLPPVTFAQAGTLRRGQWTIALGNPVGLAARGEMCMSVGVVSALSRDLPKLSAREGRQYSNLIQTTAEVNPGNSGGPLFDLNGRVVGVVTAVVLPHRTTNGLGFAIPADEALQARIRQLRKGLPVTYGYLGVAVGDLVGGGVQVTRVGHDTPASGVLRTGDLLLRIDGRYVRDEEAFLRILGSSPVDRPVSLAIVRDGREAAVSVRLVPRMDGPQGISLTSQRLHWAGLTLGFADQDAAGGVRVLHVSSDSPHAARGLRAGSVIRYVAGRSTPDLVTLQQVINDTPAELCHVGLADDLGESIRRRIDDRANDRLNDRVRTASVGN